MIRPTDIESSSFLRRLARRRPPADGTELQDEGGNWLERFVVPDGWLLTWVPFALSAACREVRSRGADCIITTSPGESTHLIGLRVRGLGPAWLADFRDGWIFEPARPAFSLRLLDAVDKRLEAKVIERADRVVAVTQELVTDFKTRLGADAVYIPNGWDPELTGLDERAPDRSAAGTARLVYTGRLGAGTRWRRPEPFFVALDCFHDREPSLAANLEVVLAGPQTSRDAALLASLNHAEAITDLGEISRDEAIRLQRSANALMVCTSGSAATSKIFEYLAAGRPILHVGGTGAAARILRETGSGVTVSADDIDGIVDRLREIASGTFGRDFTAQQGIEQYSYPRLAERMAGVIEDAITRRRVRS